MISVCSLRNMLSASSRSELIILCPNHAAFSGSATALYFKARVDTFTTIREPIAIIHTFGDHANTPVATQAKWWLARLNHQSSSKPHVGQLPTYSRWFKTEDWNIRGWKSLFNRWDMVQAWRRCCSTGCRHWEIQREVHVPDKRRGNPESPWSCLHASDCAPSFLLTFFLQFLSLIGVTTIDHVAKDWWLKNKTAPGFVSRSKTMHATEIVIAINHVCHTIFSLLYNPIFSFLHRSDLTSSSITPTWQCRFSQSPLIGNSTLLGGSLLVYDSQ